MDTKSQLAKVARSAHKLIAEVHLAAGDSFDVRFTVKDFDGEYGILYAESARGGREQFPFQVGATGVEISGSAKLMDVLAPHVEKALGWED